MLRNYFEFYRNLSTGLVEILLGIFDDRTVWLLALCFIHSVITLLGCLFISEGREYAKDDWEDWHKPLDRVKYHVLGAWYWLAVPFLTISLMAASYALFPNQSDIITRGIFISLTVHGGAIFIGHMMKADSKRDEEEIVEKIRRERWNS